MPPKSGTTDTLSGRQTSPNPSSAKNSTPAITASHFVTRNFAALTTQMKVQAEAKPRENRSKNTTKASGEEPSKRPRPSRTVRLNDLKGLTRNLEAMTTPMKVRAEAKPRENRSKNTTKASGEKPSKRPRPSTTVRLNDPKGLTRNFPAITTQMKVPAEAKPGKNRSKNTTKASGEEPSKRPRPSWTVRLNDLKGLTRNFAAMTTQMKVQAEAKPRMNRSKNTTKASGEEPSKRPRPSRTVRLNDLKGLKLRFNGSGLYSKDLQDLYYFGGKCYEQVVRGNPPDSVAKNSKKEEFHQFRKYAEPEFLKPLPEGFDLWTNEQKFGVLNELLKEFVNAVSPMLNQDAGMTEGNYPDGEGSAATIANQDADMMQGKYPKNMRIDEGTTPVFVNQDVDITQGDYHESTQGCAADPVLEAMANLSNLLEALLQKLARHQLDKPQGRPPPSPDYLLQFHDELSQVIGKVKPLASSHPDIFREIEVHEKGMMACVNDLRDPEARGAASKGPIKKSSGIELYPNFETNIATVHPPNQLSKPVTEDGSSWVTCHHDNHPVFDLESGLNTSPPATPQGKQHGLISNQAISEAPEEVPRHTGQLKLSGTDSHPQVYGGRSIGSLEHHPPKQFIGPRGSHPQVCDPGDMQTGGEKFMTQSFGGLNNTSAIAGMDYSLPAELRGVGQATWPVEKQNSFDTASLEIISILALFEDEAPCLNREVELN